MHRNWTDADLRRLGVAAPGPAQPKRNKFNAQKVELDGHKFDSKREAEFYRQLVIARVKDLILQPRFTLEDGFRDATGKWRRPIVYVADFQFQRDGRTVVVDVKSGPTKTRAFAMKWKMAQKRFPHLTWEIWE